MKNPEVAFLFLFLCGHTGLQPFVYGAAGETRKLADYLHRSIGNEETPGQVFMSEVGLGEHLKERVRLTPPGNDHRLVSTGDHNTKVHPGGVKALHLSLAGAGQVRAMWMNPVPFTRPADFKPQCTYHVIRAEVMLEGNVTEGRAYTYTAGMFNATLNEAVMKYEPGNEPVTINYQCGDENYVMSPPYNFTMQPTTVQKGSNAEERPQNFSKVPNASHGHTCKGNTCLKGEERLGKVALIADMGIEEDAFTIRSIQEYVNQGKIDFVLHAGDISYADDFGPSFGSHDGNNSWVWVQYMTSLQNVTAKVPYMTSPGNHEEEFNFAAYLNWLHMPWNESGSSSPFYYSFDYLGVHFVGISTEHDLSLNSTQNRWLAQDLKTADQNRAETPWILVFGHRPLYCSCAIFWTDRCTVEAEEYRKDLDELFRRYHVDVYVCGHNHQYERSWPVSFGTVTAKNYNNPAGTVHIVTGAAGNPEGNDPTFVPWFMAPWRAGYSLSLQTGWTLMEVNSTALVFSYIHSVDSGRVVDSFTITKNK